MVFFKTQKKNKKKKQTLKNSQNFSSIDNRISFINKILSGQIQISLNNFKYPFRVSKNNSLSIPLSAQQPCDILSYFNQENRNKKILLDDNGDLIGVQAVPFMVCDGLCSDKRTVKLGVKMLLFNSDDIYTYIDQEQILEAYYKSLNKKDLNLDVLKIKDLNKLDLLTEQNLYELYGIYDNELPQNSEIKMIYLLRELVISRQTPHITLPIISYQCNLKDFLARPSKIEKRIFSNKRHKNDTNLVNVLISEWCTGGSLLNYFENNIKKMNNYLHLDVLFFQLFSLFTTIHRSYPTFRHNDLHLGNILIQEIPSNSKNSYYLYKIKDIVNKNKYTNYVIPNVGFQIRLWDYDLSSIDKKVNNKIILQYDFDDCQQLNQGRNQFFDLIKFFYMFDRDIVEELGIRVKRYHKLIYHDILGGLKYNLMSKDGKRYLKSNDISDAGCLNLDIEKTTPEKILRENSNHDGIFSHFIVQDNDLSKYKFIEAYKVN